MTKWRETAGDLRSSNPAFSSKSAEWRDDLRTS